MRYFIACALILICAGTASAAESGGRPYTPPRDKNVLPLIFFQDGEPKMVSRQRSQFGGPSTFNKSGKASVIEQVIRASIAGPTAEEKQQGITGAAPEGTTLDRLEVSTDSAAIKIYLNLPPGYVGTKNYNPRVAQTMVHQISEPLIDEGVHNFAFFVKDPATGSYRPVLDYFRQRITHGPTPNDDAKALTDSAKDSSVKSPAPENAPPSGNPGQVTGALSGKAVVLNQAHGWLDDDSPAGWRVQREKLFENLEDYECPETLDAFVVPMLLNAGARVQPVREPDFQTNMVIVDNADPAPAYVETGTWSFSTLKGFINKTTASWNGLTANPFGSANAARLASITTGSPTATATYTPNIPADGYYNLYISFAKFTNRSTLAHWQVYDTGGVHEYRVNEQIDGATWYLLGNFYFKAGSNAATGKVVCLNDAPNGTIVSCDAVRFGGGMGDMARRTHGVSGKARWQEEANYYLQYTGMLDANQGYTFMSGDPTSTEDDEMLGWGNRTQYANWEQSRDGEGNNTIYVGYHTNSISGGCSGSTEVSGTARGTTMYRDKDGDATAGTISLTDACHTAFINNITKLYDPTWVDRGIQAVDGYGESNQDSGNGNLGTVSGFFFEALFHDNTTDIAASKDPKYRTCAARGIVQGIISYFGGTVFPPEPPVSLRVKNTGGNQVRLDWAATPNVRDANHPYGSAATGYRVYVSSDGYGFDSGTDTANTFFTASLAAGQLAFYRVSAVNTAGVSIPTETLGVRVGSSPSVLIVNGSNRYDRFLARLVPAVSGCADNLVRKIDPRNFQSFNYIIQHGKAIANSNIAFDSSADECVEQGLVTLTPYKMVDWIGAQEAEADTADPEDNTALKPASMTTLQNFLQGGGRVFMSNSELAWDFDRGSGPTQAKRDFLHNYLKATFLNDSAGTYQAQGTVGGIFSGVGTFNFDDGTGVTYNVRFPDVLTATGSTACMSYIGGIGGTACVQFSGSFNGSPTPGKIVYLGFGFETITSQTTRNAVMANILNYFGVSGVDKWSAY